MEKESILVIKEILNLHTHTHTRARARAQSKIKYLITLSYIRNIVSIRFPCVLVTSVC